MLLSALSLNSIVIFKKKKQTTKYSAAGRDVTQFPRSVRSMIRYLCLSLQSESLPSYPALQVTFGGPGWWAPRQLPALHQ